jgi:hypothetical protein
MQPLLPWIIAAVSLALLLGAAMLTARHTQRPPKRSLPSQWSITARPVFSSEERRVFKQLRDALPHLVVLCKLPLVRFCQPIDPDEMRYWFDLLGVNHVSFAICSSSGRVLAAIDLENERGGSRRGQKIKEAVLAACKIRYVRCTAERLPSLSELQLLVPQFAPSAHGPKAASALGDARVHLATTLANRRRERPAGWADSAMMQDSFFGPEGQVESATVSDFGAGRRAGAVRAVANGVANGVGETAGIVIENPASPLRH